MSSGSTIPYHLRQNKAVERVLFEEQLKLISPWLSNNGAQPIENYRYIGFGGPFLEDFKSIHRNLKIQDMTSIEFDANTLKRQEFNKPVSCIKLLSKPMSSTEFINKDEFEKESILWLDYVNVNYVSQLNDIKNAVQKMADYDILKVTFNANVANLKQQGSGSLQQQRHRYFEDLIANEYLPVTLESDDFTFKRFHRVLVRTIINAINSGLRSSTTLQAKILSSFLYKDGQQMLTVSCILLPTIKISDFELNCDLVNWEFYYDQDKIFDISLPSLSVRERVELERLLPQGDLNTIKGCLGYQISNDLAENDILLKNFIEYHARFPWFGKIAI